LNTAVLIPVFNEGDKFRSFLTEVRKFFPPDRTIVIDDGSNDNCCQGLESFGVTLLRHPDNQGKGAALKTGFKYAIEQGYQWILTLDADGQHDPAYIPCFLEKSQSGNYGIIAGSRRKSLKTMPLDRRFSNLTTSFILSLISGQKILDAQCGHRLYAADFLRQISLKTFAFDTENELLLKAFKTGTKIAWLDIPTIYQGETSQIRRFTDTLKFLKLLFKFLCRNDF